MQAVKYTFRPYVNCVYAFQTILLPSSYTYHLHDSKCGLADCLFRVLSNVKMARELISSF